VYTYPALYDVASGTVAQSEHSMIVTPDGAEVLT